MRNVWSASVMALIAAIPVVVQGGELKPVNVSVGRQLQAIATVRLSEAAPREGLPLTLTSSDPKYVLLATEPDEAGKPSITITIRGGLRDTPAFYIQGFAGSGTVTYTASAPGFETATGVVTLAPSALMLKTPIRFGVPGFTTTARAGKSPVTVFSAMLDSSLNYVSHQPIAGGLKITANVTSSNHEVGTITQSQVIIYGGSGSVTTHFLPASEGKTTLSISVPDGFSMPTEASSIVAMVMVPGISLGDELSVGKDLQTSGNLLLGQVAPENGLAVTLTSNDPNLLLSGSPTEPGSQSIVITVPAGTASARYYIQALADKGVASYTASAAGYRSRMTTAVLTPSGVLLGIYGPPDEAELFRKESGEAEHGFSFPLAQKTAPIDIYTAQLHPEHFRAADITVQPLRPGVSITVNLKSSNPEIGTIESPVTLTGNARGSAPFTAHKPGRTTISIETPKGFSTPGNATSLTAIITE